MAYHSQQVLLMRHDQEKYLDSVLKNRNKNNTILEEDIVKNTQEKNIIFVLVATPVEEVGRDHDFDWAIIEPSSFRSFIQMAGRVLRHRDIYPDKPNIGIMKYNYKTLKIVKQQGEKGLEKYPVFKNPGYQKNAKDLKKYALDKLINVTSPKLSLNFTCACGIALSHQLLSNQPFNVSGPRISLVSNSAITLCSKFENSQAL
jgi:CRISPR-associated endonuclease/helicase Cas3